MTLLGRETPDLPAEMLFSDIEIWVLEDFGQERGERRPDNLGGGRSGGLSALRGKQGAVPGAEILWKALHSARGRHSGS